MKYILGILLSLLSFDAFAQIELVRPSDFRYYVTVDSDTVASRSLEYKATQDAMWAKHEYPNSKVVIHPLGIEVRGYFPVVTEYVEVVDTVYTVNTVYEDMIRAVDWQHRQSAPDKHIITLDIDSDFPTTYNIDVCGFTWTAGDTITCSEMAYISVSATYENRTVTVRDSVDLETLNDFFLTTTEDTMAFAGGDGSQGNPYQIDTAEAFNDVYLDYAAYYMLISDVDFEGGNAVGWRGDLTGGFDMNGFSLLNIGGVTNEFGGGVDELFSIASGSYLRAGEVNFDMSYSGSGTLTILVTNDADVIEEIKISGSITSSVGGIRTSFARTGGTIQNIYNQASLESPSDVIGLGGSQGGANFINSLAYGGLTSTSGTAYGLAGGVVFGTYTDCFWDEQSTGTTISDRDTGLTTSQAQSLSTYQNAGWDIVDISQHDGDRATAIWFIDDGNDYPKLWFEYESGGGTSVSVDSTTQAQSLSEPTIDASYNTQPNSLSQAQSLSEPSISSAYNVSPNDLTQSQSLSEALVTFGISINPENINQSQSISASDISAFFTIEPETILQGQQLSQPSIDVNYVVVTDSLEQAQSVSESLVSSGQIINPNNIEQGQSVSQVSVDDLAFLVAPEDLNQSQALSQPVIGVVGFATDMSISANEIYSITLQEKELYIITTSAKPIIE